jgi:aspartate racemase
MAQHVGIIACSAEGAALCYKTICLEGSTLFGEYGHPEVSIHSLSLGDYMRCIEGGDWRGVGALMLESANRLAASGADFLICPDNTIHQALHFIDDRLLLPWLHIAEVVAEEAARRGFRRVGITGTRWLVESEVYPETLEARGLEWLRPELAGREQINRIIMDELVRGVVNPDSLAVLQRIIEGLKQGGCDAVVLGCTELPLILSDENSPLPTLDSTRLLARAALRRAAEPKV